MLWLTPDHCLWLCKRMRWREHNTVAPLPRCQWRHHCKMAALPSRKFWLHFCTKQGGGDVLFIFIHVDGLIDFFDVQTGTHWVFLTVEEKKMCLRSNMYTKTPLSLKTVPTNRNTGLHLNSGIIRLTCFSERKSPQCQILVRATQRHGRALWDPDKPVTARQSVEQGEKFEMFYGAVMGFCAQSSILWSWWNVTSATMRSFSFWNHPATL